jgi:hypothetical protein
LILFFFNFIFNFNFDFLFLFNLIFSFFFPPVSFGGFGTQPGAGNGTMWGVVAGNAVVQAPWLKAPAAKTTTTKAPSATKTLHATGKLSTAATAILVLAAFAAALIGFGSGRIAHRYRQVAQQP